MGSVCVGILSREFFDRDLGRMGGFGFAARRVADTLATLAPHAEPVLLSGSAPGPEGAREVRLGETRVVFGTGNVALDAWRWRRLEIDALLTIDWHSSFVPVCRALPRIPLLIWSRDPRGPAEWANVATLRLPGASGHELESPGAEHDPGPAKLLERSRRRRRPVRFLLTDEFLADRFRARFGIDPGGPTVLGTPVDALVPSEAARSGPPGIEAMPEVPPAIRAGAPFALFLGRLDPIKRPWLFAALAAGMPDMQFVALGQQHIERGWQPEPAANLHWLGHVDGAAKDALLASAVATVNTSIHEAVPLSMLESLHHATPLVSCLELGGLTARFGVAVPPAAGDGLEAVPGLTRAVRTLAADAGGRRALGFAGQVWVRDRHSRRGFTDALGRVLVEVGVGAPWLAPTA